MTTRATTSHSPSVSIKMGGRLNPGVVVSDQIPHAVPLRVMLEVPGETFSHSVRSGVGKVVEMVAVTPKATT